MSSAKETAVKATIQAMRLPPALAGELLGRPAPQGQGLVLMLEEGSWGVYTPPVGYLADPAYEVGLAA